MGEGPPPISLLFRNSLFVMSTVVTRSNRFLNPIKSYEIRTLQLRVNLRDHFLTHEHGCLNIAQGDPWEPWDSVRH